MLLSIQKVKEIYAICRRILINWEKEGLITLSGHLYYTSFAARIYGQRGAKRHGNSSSQANF